MISDPSSSADCDDAPRRQSFESSDRLPLFCDEKETKRIVEENQCPEYSGRVADPGEDTKVSGASRDAPSAGTAAAGAKRATTRTAAASSKGASAGTGTGTGTATATSTATSLDPSRSTTKQKLRLQPVVDPSPGVDYLKPRKVPSMAATHQARSNKAYDLRYEYTRKGATIPSTMLEHMNEYNKPLFLRFWKGNRCFEYANDRVQPLIRQEMKRRRSSGESYKSTKAPTREYRHSFAKRRQAPGSVATSQSPSSESSTTRGTRGGSGYTTGGGSISPKSRTSGYTTGTGSSPSASRGSAGSGYTTGGAGSPQRSSPSQATGSSPSTQKGATRTYPSTRATGPGTGASRATQAKAATSPQKGQKTGSTAKNTSTVKTKGIFMPTWW